MCILVVYASLALTAWRPAVSRATERWANPLIGLASGAVAGVTGVAAVPFLPYMQSLDIDRHDLVQALGIMFLFIIGALTVALAVQGAFISPTFWARSPPSCRPSWACGSARRPAMRSRPKLSARIFLLGMFVGRAAHGEDLAVEFKAAHAPPHP